MISLLSIQVTLWPEFDRAATLVILNGRLPAGTPLPTELSLRIPAAAGQPFAVAVLGSDGTLLTTSYTTQPAGSAIIVTFSTDVPDFHLEYYDPALVVAGETRDYTFEWTTDYAVAVVVMRVQQPFGARDFTAEPALVATGPGEYGLNYWQGNLGALVPGQTLSVTLSYAKSDATLSADAVDTTPATASAPAAAASTAQATGSNLPLIVAAGGLSLVLVGAGAVVYRMRRRPLRPSRAPRRHRGNLAARRASAAPAQPTPAARAPATGAAVPAFCTQCGQPRQPGDKFCRQCGAPVRA